MKKQVFAWILMIVFVFSAYCGAESVKKRVLMDGVAAKVNNDVITIGDVGAQMEPARRRLSRLFKGGELRRRLKVAYSDALQSLVERKLIMQAYEKQEMKLPEFVIDERLSEIIHESYDGDRSKLMAVLAKDQITYEEWRSEIRERIVVSTMRGSFVGRGVTVSPTEVKGYYDEHKDEYRSPLKVKLSMIFLKESSGASKLAESLLKQLKEGGDFSSLATKHSNGMRAENGGDWGWIEPKMLRKELAEAAIELKDGGLSGVVKARGGLYILKVDGRKTAAVQSFADVQTEIERAIKRKKEAELFKSWIAKLKSDAVIEYLNKDIL